ncbi:thiolase-like protein [Leptodontidium sp. 2 PMI_412]|nr:thiolase-like protein [Leptodontidium sp. 2 PMI_412]
MGTQIPRGQLDDVAIIGLACRFPGGASNESKFWELLHKRRCKCSFVSLNYLHSFHHPSNGKLNILRAAGEHFLDGNMAAFDAPFFDITSQEAKAMDPTGRLLFEVSYEALENSGLPIESIARSDTSCYVGCFTRDYYEIMIRDIELALIYTGTGIIFVVNNINIILGLNLSLWLFNLNILFISGLSKSFSNEVSGYGRGEGITIVILKSVTDAIKDSDTIRAIIRGTSVNQDGHIIGITIRMTYVNTGLNPSKTPYFEAHGTGTSVGDPLELAAVAKTLFQGRKHESNMSSR